MVQQNNLRFCKIFVFKIFHSTVRILLGFAHLFATAQVGFSRISGVLRRLGKAVVKFKDGTNQAIPSNPAHEFLGSFYIPSNPAHEFLGSLYRSSAVEYIRCLAVISRAIHVTYPHHFSCDLPCRSN